MHTGRQESLLSQEPLVRPLSINSDWQTEGTDWLTSFQIHY